MSDATETHNQGKTFKEPKIYLAKEVGVDNDINRIVKIVYLFSCHRKMMGLSSNVLREKLILLISIYIKYGYSKESKVTAAKLLGVDKPAINSMNLELRRSNFLTKDKMNTRKNSLHPDLEKLKEYIDSNGEDPLYFLVKIDYD